MNSLIRYSIGLNKLRIHIIRGLSTNNGSEKSNIYPLICVTKKIEGNDKEVNTEKENDSSNLIKQKEKKIRVCSFFPFNV